MDEAKEVLKLMESSKLKPDVYTYTIIISGYAKRGLMNEAQQTLAEAKQKHEKLSPVTYHALIRGYCKIQDYGEALKLLSEIDLFGVKLDGEEYNNLMQAFCLEDLDWEKAEMLVEEMKQKGWNLNAITQRLIRAVKEMEFEAKGLTMEPLPTITETFTHLGQSVGDWKKELSSLLAELCLRLLEWIAKAYPSVGRSYSPFLSVLYNKRNKVTSWITRGKSQKKKKFSQEEATSDLGRIDSIIVGALFSLCMELFLKEKKEEVVKRLQEKRNKMILYIRLDFDPRQAWD